MKTYRVIHEGRVKAENVVDAIRSYKRQMRICTEEWNGSLDINDHFDAGLIRVEEVGGI